MRRRTTLIVAIGLFGVAGCGGGGESPSMVANRAFVNAVRHAAPSASNADAGHLEVLGHAICTDMSSGATIQQELTVLQKADVAADVATGALTGAITAYCPQFKQALAPSTTSP